MEKKEEENNDSQEKKEEKKEAPKEPKKNMGKKFLSLIKTKFNNITNQVDKKISNLIKDKKKPKEPKEKNDAKEMEDKNEEPKEEKEENNQEKESIDESKEEKDKEEKEELKEDKNENDEDNNKANELITETPLIKKSDDIKIVSDINANDIPVNNPEEKSDEKKAEKKEEFSKTGLKKLFFRFHTILIENKKYDLFVQEITTLLEDLAEFLIYGDKNDQSLLEVFVSLNFLYDILCMMGKMNKNINIQIIKFFSVLMANLSEKNFNFFLINCDYINQVIYESRETIDGDYLYYYINFVKALLFKINK